MNATSSDEVHCTKKVCVCFHVTSNLKLDEALTKTWPEFYEIRIAELKKIGFDYFKH